MAYLNSKSRIQSAPIHGFLASLSAQLRDWNDRRITRIELNKLSERELEDIGLSRADIDTLYN